jgi:hypothetical protein
MPKEKRFKQKIEREIAVRQAVEEKNRREIAERQAFEEKVQRKLSEEQLLQERRQHDAELQQISSKGKVDRPSVAEAKWSRNIHHVHVHCERFGCSSRIFPSVAW